MIDTTRLIETFKTIVAIDSPTGREQPMVDFLTHFFSTSRATIATDEHRNVLVTVAGHGAHTDSTPLFFNAHIDTVEPGRGIECIVDGDTLRSKGETILGADNKVAVAALLEMLTVLEEKQLDHPPLEVLFTASEEVANLGALHFDYTKLSATHGYSFDSGEDTGTIIIASPYYNRFDITIHGKASHAARPEQGINALDIFCLGYATFRMGRISENTVCNIGHIEAGHVRNTVPGELTIRGEVRSFVEKELEETTELIVENFTKKAEHYGATITVDVVRENGGFDYAEDDAFVQFGATHVHACSKTPRFFRASGCYDANIFSEKGIKVLNFANGSRDSHSTNEHISIADFVYTTELALSLAQTPYPIVA
jgi:tripeptide aminopeptidase